MVYQGVNNKILIWGFLAFLPLLITPLLAVQIPRFTTYLPIITIIFSMPLMLGNLKVGFASFKTFFILVFTTLIFLYLHNFFIADFDEAYDRFSKLTALFIVGSIFLISANYIVNENFQKYLNFLIVSCVVSSFIVFLEIKFDGVLYELLRLNSDKSPYNVTVFNRSSVTICFLLVIAFCLIEKKKWYHFISLISVLPMLIVSSSQSAQLLMVFTPLFYFLFPAKYKLAWIIVLVGLGVVIFIKPFIIPYLFQDIPNLRESNYFLRYSAAGPRLEIWDYISRKVWDHPWVGHGLEFTRTYKEFDTQGIYYKKTQVMHPHNFALQLWIEYGFLGVTIFYAYICALAVYFYKNLTGYVQQSSITLLMSFLLISLVSHGMWQSWWVSLAFMLSGMIVMAHRYTKVK